MSNLAQNLLDTAAEDGDHAALRTDDAVLTHGEFRAAALYPREIEEALDEHEAVAEAACIGIAHPELGEEVEVGHR